jgi:dipeptidase E
VPVRQIITLGGGGFSMEPDNPLLDQFILSLARQSSPNICFVPTASGDSPTYIERFYTAFAEHDCRPIDLQLFKRTAYHTANKALLDQVLREAWERGIVLCGISAGMNCWFEQSVTDSFDLNQLRAFDDGLALLQGSGCPHYDGEPQRRPTYQQLIRSGALAAGWAADDGAGIVFADGSEPEVVSSRPTACAYRVRRTVDGVDEQRLIGRYLGRAECVVNCGAQLQPELSGQPLQVLTPALRLGRIVLQFTVEQRDQREGDLVAGGAYARGLQPLAQSRLGFVTAPQGQ